MRSLLAPAACAPASPRGRAAICSGTMPDGRGEHERRHRAGPRPSTPRSAPRTSGRPAPAARRRAASVASASTSTSPSNVKVSSGIAAAVAGHVEGDHAAAAGEPLGERCPVVQRAGEAVQEHHRRARTPLGDIDPQAVDRECTVVHMSQGSTSASRRVSNPQREELGSARRRLGGRSATTRARTFAVLTELDRAVQAALAPGKTVLELACGPGDTAVELAPAIVPGGRYIVTDRAEEMVAAQQRSADVGRPERRDRAARDRRRADRPAGRERRRGGVPVRPDADSRPARRRSRDPARAAARRALCLRRLGHRGAKSVGHGGCGMCSSELDRRPRSRPGRTGHVRALRPGQLAALLSDAGLDAARHRSRST